MTTSLNRASLVTPGGVGDMVAGGATTTGPAISGSLGAAPAAPAWPPAWPSQPKPAAVSSIAGANLPLRFRPLRAPVNSSGSVIATTPVDLVRCLPDSRGRAPERQTAS